MAEIRLLSWHVRGLGLHWRTLRDVVSLVQPTVVCLQDFKPASAYPQPDRSQRWHDQLRALGFRYIAMPPWSLPTPAQGVTSQRVATRSRGRGSDPWRGVLIASKRKPQRTWSLTPADDHEGRHVAMQLTADLAVHSVLAPSVPPSTQHPYTHAPHARARNTLAQQWLRKQQFFAELGSALRAPSGGDVSAPSALVVCGGLDVIASPHDHAASRSDSPARALREAQDAACLQTLTAHNTFPLIDALRLFLPHPIPLTTRWDTVGDTRLGDRLELDDRPRLAQVDQVLLSASLARACTFADVIEEIRIIPGSAKHAPLVVEFDAG